MKNIINNGLGIISNRRDITSFGFVNRFLNPNLGGGPTPTPTPTPTPPPADLARITEDGDYRITVDGDYRIVYSDGPTFVNSTSLLFGGTDEYGSAGDVLDKNGTEAFTISVWCTVLAGTMGLQNKGDASTFYRFRIGPTGLLAFDMQGDGKYVVRNGTTDLRIGAAWRHVVATYDGSGSNVGMNVYVDGSNDNASGSGTTLGNTTNAEPFYIGRGSATAFFQGNQKDFSLWNKEFSPTEVLELFNSGSPSNLLDHSASVNLEAWWRMGDGAGDNNPYITDMSGNGFDLTLYNMEDGDLVEDSP